jgi:hypothetical protein
MKGRTYPCDESIKEYNAQEYIFLGGMKGFLTDTFRKISEENRVK